MADKKLVWVKATARGQLPNRTWVDENSPPFQVEDGKESKRWMKKLTAAEAKKLTAELDEGVDDGVSASDLTAITEERDELAGRIEGLENDLKAMTDERDKLNEDVQKLASDLAAVTAERDKLKAPPAGSVAGARKD